MSETALRLTDQEGGILAGDEGPAKKLAMGIVSEMARILKAPELVEITSSHIDGCLHHGDGGVEFAEKLVQLGASVEVPTTLNVGALDLLRPDRIRSDAGRRDMALRQMQAYERLGCKPTWTCAPYQVGHRPSLGEHVAWGESNAVVFANSVLGARTNRYGDFMDICCALVGRAPMTGLHTDQARRATVHVDLEGLSDQLKRRDVFYPVLGTWLGRNVADRVPVLTGLPTTVTEDQLKAMGAAAASSGAVGLFHVVGVTPEAAEFGSVVEPGVRLSRLDVQPNLLHAVRDSLSTTTSDRIDAVALGSPHFSPGEFTALETLLPSEAFQVPFYVCTGRDHYAQLKEEGRLGRFEEAGVQIVVDTCVVVAPILPPKGGVLMTNSGKFAHYTPANTGYDVAYGSLEDCVKSAVTGYVSRDEGVWK